MSGFEVTGVVLGLFPLVITGVEKYSEMAKRLGLWHQIRLEHCKCLRDLRFHRTVLLSQLRQLLLPLVVDDAHVKRLLADLGGAGWKETWIDGSLRERLGESYDLYFEYINGMLGVLEDLRHELALDSDTVQEKLSTPRTAMSAARLRGSISKEGREFQLYRAKFSNRESARKELFAQLQSYNDRLEKLLSTSDRDAQLRQQTASMCQGTNLDPAMCSFWKLSARLYRVLASAWSCGCREQHSAQLLLQHQTVSRAEFRVVFATPVASQWQIHKTRITQQMDDGRTAASAGTRISDAAASSAVLHDQCCGYLAGEGKEDNRFYVFSLSRKTTDALPSVTLDQVLRGDVHPRPTRRQRYTLALILASSFLQFMDTQWLPTRSWRKADIVFYGDRDRDVGNDDGNDASGNNPNRHVFQLDQPHLSRRLEMISGATRAAAPATSDSDDEAEATSSAAVVIAQSLNQLGIVLLELCFGRPLAEQPCRRAWRAGDTEAERRGFDLLAAKRWQYEVYEEAGADYSDAVEWCLGAQHRAGRWRHEMLRRVVQPLQRCQDYLTGASLGQRATT
ncbi:hypothetical protein NEMBOFW57_010614 [Staphylotrichum longicolle]|uniref:DUF7580 domain-containing protein n=1 Tax=Staphylotrichum longicolle TaxID=669026 RepID=A0AAD4HVF5_9PEZI|nr:hypothetical protein NEMBOFW57_010614 [Staphylotrichum longicolle]